MKKVLEKVVETMPGIEIVLIALLIIAVVVAFIMLKRYLKQRSDRIYVAYQTKRELEIAQVRQQRIYEITMCSSHHELTIEDYLFIINECSDQEQLQVKIVSPKLFNVFVEVCRTKQQLVFKSTLINVLVAWEKIFKTNYNDDFLKIIIYCVEHLLLQVLPIQQYKGVDSFVSVIEKNCPEILKHSKSEEVKRLLNPEVYRRKY